MKFFTKWANKEDNREKKNKKTNLYLGLFNLQWGRRIGFVTDKASTINCIGERKKKKEAFLARADTNS